MFPDTVEIYHGTSKSSLEMAALPFFLDFIINVAVYKRSCQKLKGGSGERRRMIMNPMRRTVNRPTQYYGSESIYGTSNILIFLYISAFSVYSFNVVFNYSRTKCRNY